MITPPNQQDQGLLGINEEMFPRIMHVLQLSSLAYGHWTPMYQDMPSHLLRQPLLDLENIAHHRDNMLDHELIGFANSAVPRRAYTTYTPPCYATS